MTESANLTTLTPNFITDTSGSVWGLAPSFSNGNQVCHNGAIQTSTANVVLLLYCNHAVYHQNISGKWYVYNITGGWTTTVDPRVTESPSGSTVTTIGPAIIDSFLEFWTLINPGTTRGVQVACNGVTDTITGSVVLLLYYNHLLYQENSFGGWWYKSKGSDAWTAASDPRVAPPTPVPVPTPTPVPTTPVPVPTPTPVPTTPVPVPTPTPVPTPSSWSNPPLQASAAGYNTLKFFDDFTSASTITVTNSMTQRAFNWYPASWGGNMVMGTQIQVNPTWTAGNANMVAQGVSGAGLNASPNGGIVRLQGGASNSTIISVDGWIQTPPTSGTFQHYYAECYIQYRPTDITTNSQTVGWPGWWSWSVENLRGLGFGGSPFSGSYTEIDFWEYANFSTGHWGGSALHGSMGGGVGINTPGVVIDNNWHTIGCLWTPTAVTFWYDNVQIGGSYTPSAALETEHQFIMLGSGVIVTPQNSTQPCPIYVDWVRCWTA